MNPDKWIYIGPDSAVPVSVDPDTTKVAVKYRGWKAGDFVIVSAYAVDWNKVYAYQIIADEPLASAEIMTKDKLLDAAKAAVVDRGLNYGSPEDNFGRIAALWTTHLRNVNALALGKLVTASDVAMMMGLMKIARLENDPSHLDSWTDLAGYAACGATLKKDA